MTKTVPLAMSAQEARDLVAAQAARIDALEIALRDVLGMLDDPTGSEHVRDMRGASVIARAALNHPRPSHKTR